jgi:hypothetical protein
MTQIGAAGRPFELSIERGKVREFAAATRAHSGHYASSVMPIAPPTFLATVECWTTEENLAAPEALHDISNVLHGSQEYVFHGRPLMAGDVLVGTERVEDTFTKYGSRGGLMDFLVLVTEYHDTDGLLVAESRKTLITTFATPVTT